MNKIFIIIAIISISIIYFGCKEDSPTAPKTPWNLIYSTSNGIFNKVLFVNQYLGYISGKKTISNVDKGILLKTVDGGNTWSEKYFNDFENLADIHFIDSSNGVSCGYDGSVSKGKIYKTSDSGENWVLIGSLDNQTPGNIFYIDSNTIFLSTAYLSGDGRLFQTTNGGQNWNSIIYGGVEDNINDIKFVNSNIGFLACANGRIRRTDNGGNSWNVIQAITTSGNCNEIKFIDENTGWLIGTNYQIYKSTNGGNNWVITFEQSGVGLYSMSFLNTNTGWFGGHNQIRRTDDGALTFNVQFDDNSASLISIQFINEMTGWALGSYGKVFKTTTGGN